MSESPTSRTDEAADRDLTYEQARDQLVQVVQQLESGGASLSESLALWERGERLADICQHWLDGARERIEAARAQANGPAASDEPR